MQVEIITNPSSGRGRAPAHAAAIASELLRRGHSVNVHTGSDRGDAAAWAHAAADRADRLVVVGGDGSLSAVLAGLPDSAPPLALAPLGTGNVLATELGIAGHPEEVLALIEQGRVQHFDVGEDEAGRRAFMVWGFGFDAEIVHRMEDRRRGRMRKIEYLPLVLATVQDWRPIPQRVIADGRELGEFAYGFATNLRSYGTPALRLGPAEYDDGWWEIYLFRRFDLPTGGRAALASLFGRMHRSGAVLHRRVRSVEVRGSDSAPVQVDGDAHGHTPFSFRLSGFRLPVLVHP